MAFVGGLLLSAVMALLLFAVGGWLARVEDWRSYTTAGATGYRGDERERSRTHEEKPGAGWFAGSRRSAPSSPSSR